MAYESGAQLFDKEKFPANAAKKNSIASVYVLIQNCNLFAVWIKH